MPESRQCPCRRRVGNGGLGTVHLAQIALRDDPPAGVLSVTELKSEVMRHLIDAGVDRASGPDRVDVVVRHLADGLVFKLISQRTVVRLLKIFDRQVGMLHAQRLENLLRDATFPTEIRNLSFEVAHGHDCEIVVLIGAAEAFVQLEITLAVEEVLAGEIGRVPGEIMSREAGPMREKIASRGALARDRVAHLELRQVGTDRLIPIDFPLVLKNRERKSGEGFCDRANGKLSLRGDWKPIFDVAVPVPFGVNDLAIPYHGYRYARNSPLLHGLTGKIVQAAEPFGLRHGGRRLNLLHSALLRG